MSSQRRLKWGALGAAALVAGSLLAGCGSSDSSSESSGSGSSTEPLTVMSTFAPSDARGPAFAAALAGFTEKTGIPVTPTFAGPNEIFNAYETSKLAGEEPDVLLVNLYNKALDWTESGATIPLTDQLTEWGLDKVIDPTAVAQWTDSKGRLQGLPYLGFSWPMLYNTALLKEAGVDTVPTTVEELLAATEKLRAKGITPVAMGGNDSTGQKFLLQIMETAMTPDEATAVMTSGGYCASPSAMQGLNTFVQLRDAGVFSDNAEGLSTQDMYGEFTTDTAASMFAGSWAFSLPTAEQIPNIELGGFPLPDGSTFDKPVAYKGYSAAGFWLTDNGQQRIDDYKAFIDYMYSPEVVGSFVSQAGDVPVIELPDAASALAEQPLLLAALTTLPDTVDFATFPDFSIPGPIQTPMITATASAFAKGTSADQICASLDALYTASS